MAFLNVDYNSSLADCVFTQAMLLTVKDALEFLSNSEYLPYIKRFYKSKHYEKDIIGMYNWMTLHAKSENEKLFDLHDRCPDHGIGEE